VLLVFVGGAAGTALRAGCLAVLPPADGWPVGVFVVNVLGSFLLGLLVAVLAPRSAAPSSAAPAADRARSDLRLLLGTGVLGGFTTYSALSADTVSLVAAGHSVVALVYAAGSVIVGIAAAALGVLLGGATATGARR
jgi:CrcB protein